MTREVLPILRQQRSGHIIMLSSVVGMCGFPGTGIYASTKHAVEGFSEALAAELAPLGIRVSIIEPGPFRTDFFGRSLETPAVSIDDYAESSGSRIQRLREMDGQAPGDPVRAAAAMVHLTEMADPPLRLAMGQVAYDAIQQKLETVQQDMVKHREMILGTDFPAEEMST